MNVLQHASRKVEKLYQISLKDLLFLSWSQINLLEKCISLFQRQKRQY